MNRLRALRMLSHPGLVEIVDAFDDAAGAFMVTETVHGQSLQDMIDSAAGPIAVSTIVDRLYQALDVLAYLHRHQPVVLFRDLRPANMLVDDSGRLRLMEFPIGDVVSPGFSPPEQHAGEKLDARSDLYALGATFYTLLSGQVPPSSVEIQDGRASLAPLRMLRFDTPPQLETVILKLLALARDDRYASVADVLDALKSVPRPSTGRAAPSDPEEEPAAAGFWGIAARLIGSGLANSLAAALDLSRLPSVMRYAALVMVVGGLLWGGVWL